MADLVQEIKNKLPIEELVSEYLTLKKAGVHLKALCPFHSEKTPSFIVTPERGTFHCFGCGKHGDIFTFIEEIEGIDFKEALKRLAEKASVDLSTHDFVSHSKNTDPILLKLIRNATDFYKNQLNNNPTAQKYLKSRSFNKQTINKFEIGFAPKSWDTILIFLKSLGYSQEQIIESGLAKKNDNGKVYDRFRGRIMFPIFNEKNEPVAFSGRILDNNSKEAKYINSPETSLYNKSDILYGYNFAKQAIRNNDFAILVEGQADLLAMHQAGFINTVALSGTALTEKHISKLKRFTKNILMGLDADEAGVNALIKSAQQLFGLDFDIKVLEIKSGEDPADILQKGGVDTIKKMVRDAPGLIDFLIRYYNHILRNKEKYVKVLRATVVPLVSSIESKIEQERQARKLADALSVSVESIMDDIKSVGNTTTETQWSKSEKTPSKFKSDTDLQNKLLYLTFWMDELKESIVSENFKEVYRKEINKLLTDKKSTLDEKMKPVLYAEFDKEFLSADNPEEAINTFLLISKKIILKKYLNQLAIILREKEAVGDTKSIEKINNKINKIIQELSSL